MDAYAYSGLNEAVQLTSNMFKDRWLTGFNYDKAEPISFTGAPAEFTTKTKNPFFQKNLHYISCLFTFISSHDDEGLSKFEQQEMVKWEVNGGQCIYLSVLLYSLLVYDKVFHESEINYCQGFYRHECREDNPFGLIFGKNHAGLHAWVEANGSIIDISIGQESQFFDFEGKPFILGEVPNGMELIGFRETRKTVKDYARRIAKESEMKYEQWLKYHSLSATKLFLEFHKRTKDDNFGQ